MKTKLSIIIIFFTVTDFFHNILSSDLKQSLRTAIERSDTNALKQVLQRANIAPVINSIIKQNKTPLLLAVQQNNSNIIQDLLEHGADECINFQDSLGNSALHYAVLQNNITTINLLKKYGALMLLNNEHKSPFSIAVQNNRTDIIKHLINSFSISSILNIPDASGSTPLFYAVQSKNLNLVHTLLEHEADPRIQHPKDSFPLMWAIEQQAIDIVKRLLLDQRTIQTVVTLNKNGDTPLMLAVKQNNLDIVTLLFQHDAQKTIYLTDKDGGNLLFYAMQQKQNNGALLKLLVSNGLNYIEYKHQKHSFFQSIMQQPNLKDLENLIMHTLEYGNCTKDELNHQDKAGNTPLMHAIQKELPAIVEKLLQLNADPNQANQAGDTPLSKAYASGNDHIIKLLHAHHASDFGSEPFKAIEMKMLPSLQHMFNHGENPDKKDKNGVSLLEKALEHKNFEAVALLLQHNHKNISDLLLNAFMDNQYKTAERLFEYQRQKGVYISHETYDSLRLIAAQKNDLNLINLIHTNES